MSKTNDYWVKRFEALEKQALNKGTELYKELEKQYSIAYSQIEKNILSWYNRFAKDNSISFVEAKKILTSGELQEFKWSLEEYIKYASDSTTNTLWTKQLQNASTRVHISRLDSLRIQIQNEVEKLYNQQLTGMTDIAETIYEDNYYHTAYELQKGNNVAWNLNELDSNKIAKVLKSIWTDNSTFSDKIWSNKSSLIQTLNTGIVQNIIQGNSPDDLIDLISKKFNTDLNKAGRLVMTESAYFAAEAQKDCFNELGVEKYKVLGTLDTTTCENCGKMDLQIFDMKDYQEGITAPPFHPWCRCTTIPAFDDDDEFGERIARNADGDTYYVSGDTTYEEWKKKYVDNTESESVTNSDNSSIILNDDEQYAVNKYIGSDSYKINEKLRNNIELNEDEISLTNNLDSALKKIDYYEGNVVRVLDIKNTDELKQFIERNKVGENINFKEYLSFSDKSGYNNDSNIFIYTQSKKARDIRKYNAEESELLYERNSKFFVEDVVKQEDKYYILWRDINE